MGVSTYCIGVKNVVAESSQRSDEASWESVFNRMSTLLVQPVYRRRHLTHIHTHTWYSNEVRGASWQSQTRCIRSTGFFNYLLYIPKSLPLYISSKRSMFMLTSRFCSTHFKEKLTSFPNYYNCHERCVENRDDDGKQFYGIFSLTSNIMHNYTYNDKKVRIFSYTSWNYSLILHNIIGIHNSITWTQYRAAGKSHSRHVTNNYYYYFFFVSVQHSRAHYYLIFNL